MILLLLLLHSGILLTARYFDSNRAKANALCLSGTAAGSFTIPFLIQRLLASYGFRGAVLVMGACMLHIGISAALYRKAYFVICPPVLFTPISFLSAEFTQNRTCVDVP
jgi:hypothetical protein